MKITAEPRSDQWNADDLVGGPRTFTIAGVIPGKAEQKYDIQLAGSDRAWRPPLTVLRLLIAAWGDDAAAWTGRRATLYRDDSVKFGRDQVGGIRVSHLSHIDGPVTVNLTASRGKRAKITVQPLPDAPAPTQEDRVGPVVHAFNSYSLTQANLEAYVGKPADEWGDDETANLRAAYQSLQSGAMTVADVFGGDQA